LRSVRSASFLARRRFWRRRRGGSCGVPMGRPHSANRGAPLDNRRRSVPSPGQGP
jgi:hypothetical protein